MKTEDTSETMSCIQRFLPPLQKLEIIYTDKSKTVIDACQDLQWNHHTSTPHRSETNGNGRKGRPQSERRDSCRTSLKWTPCRMKGLYDLSNCYLRNMHDKMTDVKTAFEMRFGKKFEGPSIPWEHLLDTFRLSRRTRRIHQFGKKTLTEIFLRCVSRAGGEVLKRHWLQIMNMYKDQKSQKFMSQYSETKKYSCRNLTNFRAQTEH